MTEETTGQSPEHQPAEQTGRGSGGSSPGARLRAQREAQGLDLYEVADILRLRTDVIRALEEDDFSRLPPATFVRGYIRSYADLLKLPAEDLLKEYEGLEVEPPQSLVPPGRLNRDLSHVGHGSQLAALSIVVLGLVLLVLWWVNRPEGTDITRGTASEATTAETLDDQPSPLAGQGQGGGPEGAAAAMDEAGAPPTPVVMPDGSGEAPAGPGEAPAGGESEVDQNQTGAAGSQPSQASAPASSQAVAEDAQPASVAIDLVFRADSWVEIEDGNGRLLLYRLAEAGTRTQVSGVPPVSVYLGNAPGVELKVNGEPFDLAPHTRANNVARFSVGE